MSYSGYRANDVKKCCENKLKIDFRGSKEMHGWFLLQGRKAAMITVPKGRKKVGKGLYHSMASQLRLSNDEFKDLLVCPLDKSGYERILILRIQNNNRNT